MKGTADEDYAVIRVQKDLIPRGGKLVEAYETEREIIVIGEPEHEPDEHDDSWYDTAHNCDAMGCGTLSHVLYRFGKNQK